MPNIRASYILVPVVVFVTLVSATGIIGGLVYKRHICKEGAETRTRVYYSDVEHVEETKRREAYEQFYNNCNEVNFIYHILAEYDKELIYAR